MNNELYHYGTPRHSGRYPWGSGENPYQSRHDFLSVYDELHSKGLTDKEIADGMNISVNDLRKKRSVAREEERIATINRVMKLKEKGYGNSEIGRMLGMNESSVRGYLEQGKREQESSTKSTADQLIKAVQEKGMIDIGTGVEYDLGISQTKLNTAVDILKDKGYEVHTIYVEQANNPGNYTTVKVLCEPGTEKSYVLQNKDKIGSVTTYSRDGGKTFEETKYPESVSSDRIFVRYAEDGGLQKDGVIELRRGVDDLYLGNSNYAQVRIAVDGTHYLKGMAMYSDNIPDGFDILVNSNKSAGMSKNEYFKELKDDNDMPFGAKIKANGQYFYKYDDKGRFILTNGNDPDAKQGLINKVNEEGDWDSWSKTLSSQMLSKQNVDLIKRQLDLSYAEKKAEYDEIMALTNPVIKKKLLNAFAADCDSSAVDLKAVALPGQKSHVILPFNDLKENEIYAPNYQNGQDVVLIRYPHGGLFEIPELTVNNKTSSAKKIIGNASDAVGINSKVAQKLSGADFDGDTVIVIPVNDKIKISTAPTLKELKGFDPDIYKLPKDAPKIKSQTKQTEMGKVSNLITDMTIKGADYEEIAKAVKHSMVVIDSEKHHLDYKQSYVDNDIEALKRKWQGVNPNTGQPAGASTLISRASSRAVVKERVMVDKNGKRSYTADPETGKYLYKETGRTYTDKKGKVKYATIDSTKMAETDDAFTLSSGTKKEAEYAKYANKLKSLANTSRKEALALKGMTYDPSAAKTYKKEVDSLNSRLLIALKNAPKERQAQLITAAKVETVKRDNPDADKEYLKKYKQQALANARVSVGANKKDVQVHISPKEWEAIQNGAISSSKLSKILDNADLDEIKKLATPKKSNDISTANINLIKAMERSGYTTAEIAKRVGVSTSTVNKYASN